jgi:hypothetical protein
MEGGVEENEGEREERKKRGAIEEKQSSCELKIL